ncbi:olfactory receptor class A-like protein 1 [Protopterus annectens]|uniref:olfactory receptor class A-like protein 1 n=1 Tax=Protopterus annectens TaxID=7888 RepID=UPI001CF98804|nr:olfactory receptor class A-like protein 1 [Protopterus annectens]
MDIRLIIKTTGFIFLLVLGVPANLTVLMSFLLPGISGNKLTTIDIILTKLSFVHFVIVLSRATPPFLVTILQQKLFNDSLCKFLVFVHRVFRAMSICITAVLSCYQGILLLPHSSRWVTLKQKISQNISLIILLLWIINSVFDIPGVLIYTCSDVNSSIPKYTINLEYCFVVFPNKFAYIANGTAYTLRDFLFVGLMASANGYIITILYRHKKQVQGIRNSGQKQGNSAETRAAKAVIILVSVYIILFGIDNIMWIYSMTVSNVATAVPDVRAFLFVFYAAVSPIIIIGSNKKIQLTLKHAFRKIREN